MSFFDIIEPMANMVLIKRVIKVSYNKKLMSKMNKWTITTIQLLIITSYIMHYTDGSSVTLQIAPPYLPKNKTQFKPPYASFNAVNPLLRASYPLTKPAHNCASSHDNSGWFPSLSTIIAKRIVPC